MPAPTPLYSISNNDVFVEQQAPQEKTMSTTTTTTPTRISPAVNISDITTGSWVVLEAKVIQLWENDNPSIRQIGIVGDETGIVKFISWEKSNLPLVEVDVEYRFTSLPVSEYEGKKQVALNNKSTITRIGTVQTEIPEVPTV